MTRRTRLAICVLTILFGAESAQACPACTHSVMWFVFPYYTSWIAVFLLWFVAVLVSRICQRTFKFRLIAFFVLAVGAYALSFTFYPIVLLALLILWVASYVKAFLRSRRPSPPKDNRTYLIINHLTLLCLVVTAVYFQTRFNVGGPVYRLHQICRGHQVDVYRDKVFKENLIDETTLLQMIQGDDIDAQINAAIILGMQKNSNAVPVLIEGIRQLEAYGFPYYEFTPALEKITGEPEKSKTEWLAWWDLKKQKFWKEAQQQPPRDK